MVTKNVTINGKPYVAEHRPLGWQKQGKSFTASGYGGRIPSPWMVKFGSRYRRIYVACYSNSGTAYIEGKRKGDGREWLVVDG